MAENGEITQLLRNGDCESLEKLIPLVYEELRSLAAVIFRHERANHTLQPTALVHEAYLKLVTGGEKLAWQNRAHFFGIAAQAMRQILVNHAVARRRLKRGGGQTFVTLDESIGFPSAPGVNLLALHEALETLAQIDALQAKIVELRYFGGLKIKETAAILKISTATVSREWEMARLWLYRELIRTTPDSL